MAANTEIIRQTSFKLSDNLGRYLGVPLIHSRVSKETYFPIIERVHMRLNSWKTKLLSKAGRETLIHTTLSAIPFCTMQSVWLSSQICDNTDMINRHFLWGGDENHRKMALVSWVVDDTRFDVIISLI
ncbi:Putative ribonuclease H protein At1g65750 [Linum perenne]